MESMIDAIAMVGFTVMILIVLVVVTILVGEHSDD